MKQPWATLAIGIAAGAVRVIPAAAGWLFYERSALLRGEIWRAWTGHLVHYGTGHLFWNLLVFLPTGCWLEQRWPAVTRRLYLLCPPVISGALLCFQPALERYAGLSGLAAGLLALLACLQLQAGDRPVWIWFAVLGLIGGKILLEWLTDAPLLVRGIAGFHPVPLAHLTGSFCGLVFSKLRCLSPQTE